MKESLIPITSPHDRNIVIVAEDTGMPECGMTEIGVDVYPQGTHKPIDEEIGLGVYDAMLNPFLACLWQ